MAKKVSFYRVREQEDSGMYLVSFVLVIVLVIVIDSSRGQLHLDYEHEHDYDYGKRIRCVP